MFSHETASFKACLKTLIAFCLTTFILGCLKSFALTQNKWILFFTQRSHSKFYAKLYKMQEKNLSFIYLFIYHLSLTLANIPHKKMLCHPFQLFALKTLKIYTVITRKTRKRISTQIILKH